MSDRPRPSASRIPPLGQVVRHHVETWLAVADADGREGLPPRTEHEFRRYLTCGILALGFARARATRFRQERLVAFS